MDIVLSLSVLLTTLNSIHYTCAGVAVCFTTVHSNPGLKKKPSPDNTATLPGLNSVPPQIKGSPLSQCPHFNPWAFQRVNTSGSRCCCFITTLQCKPRWHEEKKQLQLQIIVFFHRQFRRVHLLELIRHYCGTHDRAQGL